MNIDINALTLGQLKGINSFFEQNPIMSILGNSSETNKGISFAIGKKVIIRTYSAGVWFGTLAEKAGNEVILTSARRMWQWQAKQSISLSAVARFGIDADRSKIAPSVGSVWLEAIEIIPVTPDAEKSIEDAKDAIAQ